MSDGSDDSLPDGITGHRIKQEPVQYIDIRPIDEVAGHSSMCASVGSFIPDVKSEETEESGIVVPVLPEDAHPVKPKKRGGEICAAIGCHNTRYNCALSMFRFPRDHDRCRVWLINSGREDLGQFSSERLNKSKRLCSNHFEDTQFMNPLQRNSLVHTAVPTLFGTRALVYDSFHRTATPCVVSTLGSQGQKECGRSLTSRHAMSDGDDSDYVVHRQPPSSSVDAEHELNAVQRRMAKQELTTEAEDQEEFCDGGNEAGNDFTAFHTCVKIKTEAENMEEFRDGIDQAGREFKALHACAVCDMVFPDEVKLASHTCALRHIKLELPDNAAVTDTAGNREMSPKVFPVRLTVNPHFNGGTPLKPYFCYICGKSFVKKGHLKNHENTHAEESSYECKTCGKHFRWRHTLYNHQRQHTGDKPFECEDCGKKFNDRSNLNKHKRIHTGEKPYECCVCGKRYKDKSSVSRHEMTHTGERPFGCELCGKTFPRRMQLKQHIVTHSDEKPHKCATCGNGFKDKATLNQHLLIHSDEKPFPCGVCGKAFRRKHHLIDHARLHTGEKPYECYICGKRFKDKSPLNQHLRRHAKHGQKSALVKIEPSEHETFYQPEIFLPEHTSVSAQRDTNTAEKHPDAGISDTEEDSKEPCEDFHLDGQGVDAVGQF